MHKIDRRTDRIDEHAAHQETDAGHQGRVVVAEFIDIEETQYHAYAKCRPCGNLHCNKQRFPFSVSARFSRRLCRHVRFTSSERMTCSLPLNQYNTFKAFSFIKCSIFLRNSDTFFTAKRITDKRCLMPALLLHIRIGEETVHRIIGKQDFGHDFIYPICEIHSPIFQSIHP